jgi:HlyD family secretion protein
MDQTVRRPTTAPDIAATLALDKAGRSRKGARKIGFWLVLAALAGLVWYGWNAWSSASVVTKSYTSDAAARTDLVVEVSATGTLQPLTQVDVSSEQSGVIRDVPVKENQFVKKGDVLLTLDTATLSAQVERAEAGVKASNAQVADAVTSLKEAEQLLTRARSLNARGTVSQQDVDTALAKRDRAKSSVTSSEAALAVSQAELKLQQAALAKSTIYAPIDGIVLTRAADPGQTVAASLSAPVLFVIAEDLKRMKLEAAIDEADIGMVKQGQKASFKVDAYADKSFNAEITEVAYASVTTDNVVSYQAELGVTNDDLSLRPGMTANVDIVVREANDVLTVPNSAFRYQPAAEEKKSNWSLTSLFMPRFPRGSAKQSVKPAADGSRTVYVLDNGTPKAVQVRTGSTDGAKTEILSGLNEGDAVISGESTSKSR